MAIVQEDKNRQPAVRRSAARSAPLSQDDLTRLMTEQNQVYHNRDHEPQPLEQFSIPRWNEERRCWISISEIDPQKRKAYDGTAWVDIEDARESAAERHSLFNGKLTRFLCFSSP